MIQSIFDYYVIFSFAIDYTAWHTFIDISDIDEIGFNNISVCLEI